MSIVVDPEYVAKAVTMYLSQFQTGVGMAMKDIIKKAAEETVSELREESPRRKGRTGGAYAKSWRSKVISENSQSISIKIYNKKHYRLTHLLEYGHRSRNGSFTPAKPHIEQAEGFAADAVIQEIEELDWGNLP